MRGIEAVKSFVISISLCLAASANAQESPDFSGSYLCKTTASGGVAQGIGDIWGAEKFNATDENYVFKVSDTKKTWQSAYRTLKDLQRCCEEVRSNGRI